MVQAQHDPEAAELVDALRAAACVPLLTVIPACRSPHQVTSLRQLTQDLQVPPSSSFSTACVWDGLLRMTTSRMLKNLLTGK